MSNYDCIIIGAGVAGMSASIYLKRANFKVLLLEKEIPGGQINKTDLIENYPGYISIDGPTLSEKIFEQVKKLNVEYKNEEVLEIKNDIEKEVITKKNRYKAKYIIISTGRRPKNLGIDGEKELINKGISYCAICDGTFYKQKDVAVIGNNDGAVNSAIYLSKVCNKVYLISDHELKSTNQLIDRLKTHSNIEILENNVLNTLTSTNGYLSSIIVNNKELKISGLFVYVGNTPNINFIEKEIKLEKNYIIVDSHMMTNVENIYACGDIIKKDLYQITTAASEGAIAASNIIKKGK